MNKIYPSTTLGNIRRFYAEANAFAKKNFPVEACKNASTGARNNVFDKIATRYLIDKLAFPYSKEAGTILRWCFSYEKTYKNARFLNLTIEEAMLLVSLREW